ncbi:hypothetical protein ACHAQH_001367 [Verticillium albo-atrum]
MSLPRMVIKPLVNLLWTVTLFNNVYASDPFKFTGHLARFIPNCASECLISFLNDNFAETTCGATSSLQCLCAETGVSGFTIGEGAVQCIEAEQSIGSCLVGEIDRNTIDTAYFMCSDQPGAAQPTHTAIEAVLLGTILPIHNDVHDGVTVSKDNNHNPRDLHQGSRFFKLGRVILRFGPD